MTWHDVQRGWFAEELCSQMKQHSNIYLLVGDLGYGLFDSFPLLFTERFVNCGASEQAMLDIACGLAMSGKIPFVYSGTPFLLYRPFETIRTYINHEKLNVKLIGSGRDKDYLIDGFSHWAIDDKDFMKHFKNIKSHWPKTKEELIDIVQTSVRDDAPYYINLRR